MIKFSITSPRWVGEVKVTFYENNQIQNIEYPEAMPEDVLMWLATHTPVNTDLIKWIQQNSKAVITEIIEIEFEHFWHQYGKKEGSKDLAQMYWEGQKKTINKRPVTEEDRMAIMRSLQRFTARYKGDKKQYQPLATTFLNGRLWVAECEKTDATKPLSNDITIKLLEKWNVK